MVSIRQRLEQLEVKGGSKITRFAWCWDPSDETPEQAAARCEQVAAQWWADHPDQSPETCALYVVGWGLPCVDGGMPRVDGAAFYPAGETASV
jgi:hypothetical protein